MEERRVGGIVSLPLDLYGGYPTLGANVLFERTRKEDMFILGVNSDRAIVAGYVFRIFKGKKQ